jgi:hypothetical protein
MSTSSTRGTRPLKPAAAAASFLAASAVLATGTVLLVRYGPGSMGAGFAVGGAVVLVAVAFATWRGLRHPASTTTAERVLTHTGDERDQRIAERAGAVLGMFSLPLTGVAAVLVALGVPALAVLGTLVWALLAIVVIAYAVLTRRG